MHNTGELEEAPPWGRMLPFPLLARTPKMVQGLTKGWEHRLTLASDPPGTMWTSCTSETMQQKDGRREQVLQLAGLGASGLDAWV